jgi:hypothetical protein
MKIGDVVSALLLAHQYCYLYYACGLPLGPIEKYMRSFHREMCDYRIKACQDSLAPVYQAVLNLTSK